MTPNQVQQKGQSGVSIWTVVSFLLGTALGSGSIWSWQQIKLQAQKQELERVVQTTELRQRELDLDTKIIELTRKYVDSKDAYRKGPSPQINNKIFALKSQLDLMKDDFRTLENKLALQENRPPRSIQIDFIPPEPPTGLKAVVQ